MSCNQKKKMSIISDKPSDSLSVYFSLANNFDFSAELREQYIQKAMKIVVNQKNDSLHRAIYSKLLIVITT